MGIGIISAISRIINPITDLIDDLSTSDEEKGLLKNQMTRIENAFTAKVLDYEGKIAQMKADIVMTEAKGESWIQRTWRPITMLTFLVLVVLHHLGYLAIEITSDMWDLLKIGIGGYVVSRGAEKVVPAVTKMLKGGNNG